MARPTLVAVVLAAALSLVACERALRSERAPRGHPLLPEEIASSGWVRHTGVSRFAGDSLFEYIDGAAEMYHKYDFVEVNVGEYAKGDDQITADVYRFVDSDRAFGMYTTLRPDTPDTVLLGVEGFTLGQNVVFVKGAYIVNVYGYDDRDPVMQGVRLIAATIEDLVEGTSDLPSAFNLFPIAGRLPHTERMYAEAFLGHGFLTGVYTVDYASADGHTTLFMSDDPGSAKFQRWKMIVTEEDDGPAGYDDLLYDAGAYLLTDDPYRGRVIAGIRGGMLLGAVGHTDVDLELLAGWLASLPGAALISP